MVSKEFILGLIAGEGSFHIVLESPARQRPKFTMNMYESDILVRCKNELGLGHINNPRDERTEWQIQSKSDVREMKNWVEKNMCPLFRETDKYRQFKLWSEAVDIIPNDRSIIPKDDRIRLAELSYEIPKSQNKSKSKEEWMQIVRDFELHRCGEPTKDGEPCQKWVVDEDDTCRWH